MSENQESVNQSQTLSDGSSESERQLTGIDLIAEERERQQTKEGHSHEHDDEHELGEIARAAYCYEEHPPGMASQPLDWPWLTADWKPKDRLSNLVRAGALYQAEIDRLCRRRMRVTEEIDLLLASKQGSSTAKPEHA